jgi:hypothetical protein
MGARAIQFGFKLFLKILKILYSILLGYLLWYINLYRQEVLEDSQLPAFQVQIVQILAAAGGGRYREFDVVKKYC